MNMEELIQELVKHYTALEALCIHHFANNRGFYDDEKVVVIVKADKFVCTWKSNT